MSNADDARIAGRLSIAYMVAFASELLRSFPLDFLDHLLIATIANSNLQHLVQARARKAKRKALSEAAPQRIGISRNAVSRALNVPLETVRRRIARLIDKGFLVEQADGLVFTPDNALGLGNNAALNAFNMDLLRQLFRGLKAHGIDLN